MKASGVLLGLNACPEDLVSTPLSATWVNGALQWNFPFRICQGIGVQINNQRVIYIQAYFIVSGGKYKQNEVSNRLLVGVSEF